MARLKCCAWSTCLAVRRKRAAWRLMPLVAMFSMGALQQAGIAAPGYRQRGQGVRRQLSRWTPSPIGLACAEPAAR